MSVPQPPKPAPAPKNFGFIDEVEIHQNTEGDNTFTVSKPFTFVSKSGAVVTVPEDFITDLHSLPDLARCGVISILVGFLLWHSIHFEYLFGLQGILVPIGLALAWCSGNLQHFGKYTNAAVLHDWLYATKKFDRARCDWLFREALADSATEDWQRIVIFYAVRAWGLYAWRTVSPLTVIPKETDNKVM